MDLRGDKSVGILSAVHSEVSPAHPCLESDCATPFCIELNGKAFCDEGKVDVCVFDSSDEMPNDNCLPQTTRTRRFSLQFNRCQKLPGPSTVSTVYVNVAPSDDHFNVYSYEDEKCTLGNSSLEVTDACAPLLPVWFFAFSESLARRGSFNMLFNCPGGISEFEPPTTSTAPTTTSIDLPSTSTLTTLAPETQNSSSSGGVGVVPIVAALCGAIGAVVVAVLLTRMRRRSRAESKRRQALETELEQLRSTRADMENNILSQLSANKLFDEAHSSIPTIARSRIKLLDEIGHGQFGTVFRALVQRQVVAVKTLSKTSTALDRLALLREVKLMASLKHPHIVSLLYLCDEGDDLFMVLEFMGGGDLQKHLRHNRDALQQSSSLHTQLLEYAMQLCSALCFLESNRVIHRDLACRNVLLDSKKQLIKLADLGLSRVLRQDADYYRKSSDDRVPARWMAPESMKSRIYSTASDVWSFGVVIWEMYSLGAVPYGAMAALEAVRAVSDGYRLVRPEACPRDLFLIVRRCWALEPSERPSFHELEASLLEYQDADPLETGAGLNVVPIRAWMQADSQV
eukprot:m.173501 g.173501  ORF g.173501 m.173501 type:complete len:571 (-) comp10408_c0_seq3:70-1782(-)